MILVIKYSSSASCISEIDELEKQEKTLLIKERVLAKIRRKKEINEKDLKKITDTEKGIIVVSEEISRIKEFIQKTKFNSNTLKGILFRLIGEIRPLKLISDTHDFHSVIDFDKNVTYDLDIICENKESFTSRFTERGERPSKVAGFLKEENNPFYIEGDNYQTFKRIHAPLEMDETTLKEVLLTGVPLKNYSKDSVFEALDFLDSMIRTDKDKLKLITDVMYSIFKKELKENHSFFKRYISFFKKYEKKDITKIGMPWLASPKALIPGGITLKEIFIHNLKIPKSFPRQCVKSSGILNVFLDITAEKEKIVREAIKVANVGVFQFGKKGVAYLDKIHCKGR